MTLLSALLATFVAQAQYDWSYRSIDEAYNDRAYLFRPDSGAMELVVKKGRTYSAGRYQRLTAERADSIAFGSVCIITGPYLVGRTEHFRLQSAESDFYLPVSEAEAMFPYLVSVRYWDAKLDSLRSYNYLDEWALSGLLDCDTATLRSHRYSPLSWVGYEFQPSYLSPVVFRVATNVEGSQPLSLAALARLSEWKAMTTASVVDAYEAALAHARELREESDRRMRKAQDSLRDANLFAATVLRDLLAETVNQDAMAQIVAGSEVMLFAYTDTVGERDCFYGRFHNESYKFAYGDLRFASPDDVAYLMRRGRSGMDLRLKAATIADSLATERYADSLARAHAELREQIEQTKRDMDSRQIFIMNLNLAQSDYQFGLEFNFYNCFQKTIRKIEMQVTAYNAQGAMQRDKFDRRMRDVRCMGPIPPQSPAQYTFDELFWDDNGRIRYLRLTYIKFTFADGSTRSFSGYDSILKHILNP